MAATYDYVVKRGDTLWGIATKYASKISGSTTNQKIDTLVKVNNIKNKNLIYVGQGINFASKSSSGSSSSSGTESKVKILAFTLRASNDDAGNSNSKEVIAHWSWSREGTKGFVCQWEEYRPQLKTWVALGETEYTDSAEAKDCYASRSASDDSTKVRFRIRPHTGTNKDGKYTYFSNPSVAYTDWVEYLFEDNPPDKPGVPKVELDDLTLIIRYTNIDAAALGATHIKFEIVKDNKTSVHTSDLVPINTTGNEVTYQYTVVEGATYTVRACSVSSKKKESAWSEFSEEVKTRPTAPTGSITCERRKRSDGTYSVYLQWPKAENATKYQIEYVTIKDDFENAPGMIQTAKTEDASTYLELTNLSLGSTYYFRVRAIWGDQDSNISEPSGIVELPLGQKPGVPTTWSSSGSTFVGKTMELCWTHNSQDGSAQTKATLGMLIDGDDDEKIFEFDNPTVDSDDGERFEYRLEVNGVRYGVAISYEGNLYVMLNTDKAGPLADKRITWKVKTAGISVDASGNPEYSEWSIQRTVYIYTQPELYLTVPDDVESFPIRIEAETKLGDYSVQWPIGYHLSILSLNSYETVDDLGRTTVVNKGDAVFSKYFPTKNGAYELQVDITADQISLDSGRAYEVRCSVDMSTGLSISRSLGFTPIWGSYIAYSLGANIQINEDTYSALISPYSTGGDAVLAVYRREYDGSFTEIATRVPNNGTYVTDPHPALDYARYRIVGKDAASGVTSFYDIPGYPVNGKAVIIQWAEEASSYDIAGSAQTNTSRSGSMLKLEYNIDITDSRKREVELVKYAGREHPVSYYGTHSDESSTWNVVIPATDKETIYALRRLSMWTGDVYVREPSGLGYWANISVSFNLKHKDVVVPVTLEVTRVEGGM